MNENNNEEYLTMLLLFRWVIGGCSMLSMTPCVFQAVI